MTTPLRSRQPLLVTLGAMLSLLPTARAQVSFDISPYAGAYLPLGSILAPSNPLQGPWDQYGEGTAIALQNAITVGSHLTVWTARRFGIEATFGYAPSGVTGLGCRVRGCNEGHLLTASANVVVPPIDGRFLRSFYVGGGLGLVALGGPAYTDVGGTTHLAVTVGAGWVLKLASAGSVRIEAEE